MKCPTFILLKIGLTLLSLMPALSLGTTWKPIEKIAFVGNSITHHAPATERLGWDGSWGMAATSQENDYVHRLATLIAAKQNGITPQIEVFARGGGRLDGLVANADKLAALSADLIVIQMGENDNTVTEADFLAPYQRVVSILRSANPSARIVCTGAWNPGRGNPAKDAFIKKVCADNKLLFADLSAVNADPKNRASNAVQGIHPGVGWHPSDAGMDAYARAILSALEAGSTAIPTVATTSSPAVAPASTTLFSEDFATAAAINGWTPKGNGILDNGALKVSNSDAKKSVMLRRSLPHTAAIGHTIKVTGRIKAQGISTPPKSWNGIKLMLDIVNAEGVHDYPQAGVQAKSDVDWHTVTFTRPIPDNTVQLSLVIGLEQVSGEVWFDDLSVEIINPDGRPIPTSPRQPASVTNAPAAPALPAGVVFEEKFDAPASFASWVPNGNGALDNGSIKITNTNPDGAVMLRHSIPVTSIAGRTVKVSGRIKASNISTPPNRWNGIKLMLNIVNSQGVRDYPQARVDPVSDLDWHTVSFTRSIPADTAQISLLIGLEKVSGTVWFDEIKVELIP